MIQRRDLARKLSDSIKRNPVTALLGPRQCGKTTLARMFGSGKRFQYYDLENPLDMARLENPLRALENLRGLVIIDEVQRNPSLFEVLRVLSDRRPLPARFLILGSASMDLIRHSSESLAGRIGFIDMGGFSLPDVGFSDMQRLFFRGGFPRSFLARTHAESESWRENFIRTFLERDIPQFGIRISSVTLRRFWTMIAHYHAQIWNSSEIAASLGIAHPTARQYLDILTGALVIRQIQPWFENTGKRTVKSPKVYIRDSGLLHSLLRIARFSDLEGHPKLGASWEGFAIEQILNRTGDRDAYFWATHAGAELDLLIVRKSKRWGFEIKYSDAPTLTKSMRIAFKDLQLKELWVIYPGKKKYSLDEGIDCIGMEDMYGLIDKYLLRP
jgi:predicted AAA+ superfamily ATPase